jgi:hypothetical protein
MYERMGFIVKQPVRFDPRSIGSTTIDRALLADVDTYRRWWDEALDLDDSATLLCGVKPHEREEGDDDSWVDTFEWMRRRLERAVTAGEIPTYPRLAELAAWMRRVHGDLPPALADCADQDPPPSAPPLTASTARCPQRRKATVRIEEAITSLIDTLEQRAARHTESFDRRNMPGTKKELADCIKQRLPKAYRRSPATMHAYFDRLGLRWPTHAERGGLTALLTRLGMSTGSLGDLAAGNCRPISSGHTLRQ